MKTTNLIQLEQEIEDLTNHLNNLVNNDSSQLQNKAALQISQELDNLIVSYMKSVWQAI